MIQESLVYYSFQESTFNDLFRAFFDWWTFADASFHRAENGRGAETQPSAAARGGELTCELSGSFSWEERDGRGWEGIDHTHI